MTAPIRSKTPTSPLSPLRTARPEPEAPSVASAHGELGVKDSNAAQGRRFDLPQEWRIPGLDDYSSCPPQKPPAELPVAIPPVGSVDYYQQRNDDFKRRNPGVTPPDYYLEYGDKYAHRFTEELRPNLSPEGQIWLDKARENLQKAIEQKRSEDPEAFAELERDPEKFREFAYETHAKAYLDAGLADLPISDLAKIAFTPDFKDLFTEAGLEQILEVAPVVLAKKLSDLTDTAEEFFEDLFDGLTPDHCHDLIDLLAREDDPLRLLQGLSKLVPNPTEAFGKRLGEVMHDRVEALIDGLKGTMNAFRGALVKLGLD